jgi:hypothetical protein
MGEFFSEKELNTQFSILENKGDGNCLFLAVEQLDHTYNHTVLRKNVCKKWSEIKTNNPEYYQIIALSDDFIDDDGRNHDIAVCDEFVWGSLQDVAIISEILKRPIIVYSRVTNSMIQGKRNPNYGKFLKLDTLLPGTIFKDNKSYTTHEPIYLKLTLKRGYGHFEAMQPNDRIISLRTSSTNSSTRSSRKSSSKSPPKNTRKKKGKKKTKSITKNVPSTSITKKKSKSKRTTRKYINTTSSTNSEDHELKEAMRRSVIDF